MTRIEQHVDGLTDEEFLKIVNFFVDEGKAPTPRQFKEAAQRERFHRPRREYAPLPPPPVYCSRCEDLGIVRMIDEQNRLSVLGLCDCEIGKRQVWKLPRACDVTGYQVVPVPFEPFKPEIPRVKDPKNKEEAKVLEITAARAIQSKFEWWREKVRISEQFWKSENHPPPAG